MPLFSHSRSCSNFAFPDGLWGNTPTAWYLVSRVWQRIPRYDEASWRTGARSKERSVNAEYGAWRLGSYGRDDIQIGVGKWARHVHPRRYWAGRRLVDAVGFDDHEEPGREITASAKSGSWGCIFDPRATPSIVPSSMIFSGEAFYKTCLCFGHCIFMRFMLHVTLFTPLRTTL